MLWYDMLGHDMLRDILVVVVAPDLGTESDGCAMAGFAMLALLCLLAQSRMDVLWQDMLALLCLLAWSAGLHTISVQSRGRAGGGVGGGGDGGVSTHLTS